MKKNKCCIFHIPNHISMEAASGSNIRPTKMLEAFQENGYEVDYIMGYGKERKEQIEAIKKKILSGKKYDFLYSESSTMPTLLTEKNHMPMYPTLDFGFMKFCKSRGIRIGLFYRDIHWKFEKYQKDVPWYKKIPAVSMYKYDLKMYKKIVDVLYLPSKQMEKQIEEFKITDIKVLPPGAVKEEGVIEKRKKYFEKRKQDILRIFYVGGVQGIYDLTGILKAVQKREYTYLTICCRKNEWEKEKDKYKQYLTERVQIVHETGKELLQYYLESDICSCYFPNSEYMDFAVPIKLLEYTTYVTPVIATKGTEAGNFVEKFQNGFSISYGEKSIEALFDFIEENPQILLEKHQKAIECLEQNTWKQRAYQVEKDLSSKNNY